MVRPWRRKNCGRKITKPKIRLLMVISTQQPTTMRSISGWRSSAPNGTCGLGGAALRLEPARGFRQLLAQIPHDQGADAGDDEHRPPDPGANDEIGQER